jgi:NAD(P)H dehydrogenase (quinone)
MRYISRHVDLRQNCDSRSCLKAQRRSFAATVFMKHAVILAHPKRNSFNSSIAACYAEAATARGHTSQLRDLYDMSFDPCLKAAEIPGPQGFVPGQDVIAERELLKDAGVFALVYPLWLNAQPAILKGYIERVFGMGFAYGRQGGGSVPLLAGRKMISFTSSGAPIEWVKRTGAWDAMRKLFDEHIAALCGFEIVDHIHFGGIVPGIRTDAVERCFETVRLSVKRYF